MPGSTAAPRKVSVAIVSWNGRRHLDACLDALAQQRNPGVPWEVVVLDNGSTDDTVTSLRARKAPHALHLVESPANLGFAAANNRLIEQSDSDLVALLNNDTVPRPDWLATLVEALAGAPADVAAVSGLMLDWEGTRLDAGRGVMTFDGHGFQLGAGRRLAEVELPPAGAELPFPCAGNAIVRRQAFLDAGGFDADYFAYYEDIDLGWRLWARGARVIFSPGAVVRHRSGATGETLGVFNRGFLFERNAFLTAYKNYEDGLWQRIMPAIELTLLARTHTLLVSNNPGGNLLRRDPFASEVGRRAEAAVMGEAPRGSAAESARAGLMREMLRRSRRLAGRVRRKVAALATSPRLADQRTVAQLRAVSFLLGHLDEAARKRGAVQARRRRSDQEIFARFPVYLVPTYPGDEQLFAGSGFRSWLPAELPLIEKRLDEVIVP
jgi:GT2 family glycosyltransferase